MPLNLFYTKVQKKSKMTKNSNQGGPALTACGMYVVKWKLERYWPADLGL